MPVKGCKLSLYFYYFEKWCPIQGKGGPSLQNLKSPCPRMLCAKYDWNWSSGYGCIKDFEKVSDIANFSTWLVSTTERMVWRLLWTNTHLRLVCGNWKRYLKRRLHRQLHAQITRHTYRRRMTQSGNLSFQHKWG